MPASMCRCAAGGGNAWLDHEDFWSLAFDAGLRGDDQRWVDAFERLCLEEGCDLATGVCGEVFVRLVMDDLATRCHQTGASLRTMLRLIRPLGAAKAEGAAERPQAPVPVQSAQAEQATPSRLEPGISPGAPLLVQPRTAGASGLERETWADLGPLWEACCEGDELGGIASKAIAAVSACSLASDYSTDAEAAEASQGPAGFGSIAADDMHAGLAASPFYAGGMAGRAAGGAAASPPASGRQRKSGGRRSVEEERVLAELDKFKITACAKPSKATSKSKASKHASAPAPFDPLFQLETFGAPSADQDWQSMLQGVFEMETQGGSWSLRQP